MIHKPLSKLSDDEDYLLLYKIPPLLLLTVFCTYSLCIVLLRLKLFLGPDTYYLGGSHGDAGLYLWLFRHHLHHFFDYPFFETSAFFPYPLTLAWSDNFIFPALIAYPFYLIGIPESALYNGVLLLGEILTGFFTFRLFYLLRGEKYLAISVGLIPLILSYFTASLGHPQLIFAFCFPLGIELLLRSFKEPLRYGLLYGALIVLTFLTTVYYAIFLAALPLPIFISHLILRPYPENRRQFFSFLGGMIATSLPLFFFSAPYRAIKEVFGARASLEMFAFRGSGEAFISAPPLSYLYSGTHILSHAEAYFFPGILLLLTVMIPFFRLYEAKPLKLHGRITLLLLILLLITTSSRSLTFLGVSPSLISLFRTVFSPLLTYGFIVAFLTLLYRMGKLERELDCYFVTNRAVLGILYTVFFFFFFISLGPLGDGGRGEYQLGFFMIFYELFPGFDSLRAISRASIITLLLFPIFFGLFFSRTFYASKHVKVLLPLSLLIIFFENMLGAYPLEPRDGAPIVLKTANEQAKPHQAVLFLPMTDTLKENGTVKSWKNFATRNVDYMNWSLDYDLMTVNGYSGQRTKLMRELPGAMWSFPDERSIKTLSLMPNVSYIVYASKFIQGFNEEEFQKKLQYFGNEIELIEKDPEGFYLLKITAQTLLKDDTTIRAPTRWRDGKFLFQLKATYDPDAEPINVSLKELDHHGGETIHYFPLPLSGKWESFGFPLPEEVKAGLPFRFKFSFEDKNRVMIRDLQVIPK